MAVRPRILVLTTTFPRWEGDVMPRFVQDLCQRQAEDFDVHVLAPHAPGARVEEKMGDVRVFRYRYAPEPLETLTYGHGVLENIREVPARRALIPALLAAQLATGRALLHRYAYDAIHAHWLLPQGFIGMALSQSTLRQVPVLCTLHGGGAVRASQPRRK